MNRIIIKGNKISKNLVSHGLIVMNLETNKFLLVRRKHSVDFCLFIKGNYIKSHLPVLLENITSEEKRLIYNIKNYKDFVNLFIYELEFSWNEIYFAIDKFYLNFDDIHKLLKMFGCNNKLKWGFPKGRLNNNETSFNCAYREFVEEVEIELPECVFSSKEPIIEYIEILSGKVIEIHYWVYVIEKEIPIPDITYHNELSKRKWSDNKNLISGDLFEHVFQEIKNELIKPDFLNKKNGQVSVV